MLYCKRCKKNVSMNGNVGDYRCPNCGGSVKIGDAPATGAYREAQAGYTGDVVLREEAVSDSQQLEASLIESFKALGLSKTAAKEAAAGRGPQTSDGNLSVLPKGKTQPGGGAEDDLLREAVRQLLLEDTFRAFGMNEAQARAAAQGRTGLGDAVMNIFREARKTLMGIEHVNDAALADSFTRMGLSEDAAEEAAKGRE